MSRSILVIKLGALGDLFLALDVFHAIRAHHANDHIVLLTRKQYMGFASQMPWFDEVWDDSSPKPWHVSRVLALRRRLLDGSFSRVYDLQGNDRTNSYFRLLGRNAPEWVGNARGCSHFIQWRTQESKIGG